MSSQRTMFRILVSFGFVVSTFQHLQSSSSTSSHWKSFPPTGNNPILRNSNAGTTKVSEKPGKEFAHVTYDVYPAGFLGKTDLRPDTGNELQFSGTEILGIGEDERKSEKSEERKRLKGGTKIWGVGDRAERKWGENSMHVWGRKRNADEKERRKRDENPMNALDMRNDDETRESKNTIGGRNKRSWKEGKPEVVSAGFKPEVTRSTTERGRSTTERGRSTTERGRSTTERGRDSQYRRKRSVLDLEPDEDWYAVSDLSKRSKAGRHSVPVPYRGPKRNWETNTMKVWGKRSKPIWEDYIYSREPVIGGRKWTNGNAARIWGKMDPLSLSPDEEKFINLFYDP